MVQAEKSLHSRFYVGILLILPMFLLYPAVVIQSHSNHEYSGTILFVIFGSAAFAIAYIADRKGHRPFNWFQRPRKKDLSLFIWGIGSWSAIIVLVSLGYNHSYGAERSIGANIGLIVTGGFAIFLLRATQSIIGPLIIHFTNNAIDPILYWNDSSLSIYASGISAAFSEEFMKITLALGIAVLLLTWKRLVAWQSLIGLLAYVTATAIWVYYHCDAYPLPFLPCMI